jgi:hypothetical protein
MRTMVRRAVPPALSLACLFFFAATVRAQFEEPDTIPRFSIGPTFEVVFRGKRGTATINDEEISFGGGPPVGARLEYRLTRTLAIGAGGSWARTKEKRESSGSKTVSSEGFTQWQGVGELMLKVKPNIPGYFILGGGARHIVPDSDQPTDYRHDAEPFTDVMGILGAGLELGSRTSRVVKLDIRFYLVSPAEQTRMNMKSLSLDFAIGLGLMFRL